MRQTPPRESEEETLFFEHLFSGKEVNKDPVLEETPPRPSWTHGGDNYDDKTVTIYIDQTKRFGGPPQQRQSPKI